MVFEKNHREEGEGVEVYACKGFASGQNKLKVGRVQVRKVGC